MDKDLSRILFTSYPSLFRDKEDKAKSLMRFGFACGPGWFTILQELIYAIKEEEDKLAEKDPSYERLTVVQVKEKFGGLCFYVSRSTTPEIGKLIEFTENESYHVCEWCGSRNNASRIGSQGWVRTLCRPCRSREKEGFRPWDTHGT